MPSFKTHLNALLESFGLDYRNYQNITLNYAANERTSTEFTPPCDGFLILYCGSSVTSAFIADTVWNSRNVTNAGYTSGSAWLSVNALVSKGRTYALTVVWTDDDAGNSMGLFVPFTFSRQKT